ncbi:MAG: hypothetical protein WCU88_10110 [Elusimicrobiota bacterium]|jgi:hypothetical protein
MIQKKVKFDDIEGGIEFVSAGQLSVHEAFLCKKTGEVHWSSENSDEPLPDDVNDPEQYIALPHKNDLGLGKSLVMKFVNAALPDSAGRVQGFFSRQGAYASFKFLLVRKGKLEQWYEYEKKATEAAIRAWCKDNDIDLDG